MMLARWTLVFVWVLLAATVQNKNWRPCTGMRTSQTYGQMCFALLRSVLVILTDLELSGFPLTVMVCV